MHPIVILSHYPVKIIIETGQTSVLIKGSMRKNCVASDKERLNERETNFGHSSYPTDIFCGPTRGLKLMALVVSSQKGSLL